MKQHINAGITFLIFLFTTRFGQPRHDELTILAPLSQCCVIRQSTLRRIINFNDGEHHLSELMRTSLERDPVDPVVSELHFIALDRRVGIILQTIRDCLARKSTEEVISFDEL